MVREALTIKVGVALFAKVHDVIDLAIREGPLDQPRIAILSVDL